MADVSLFLLSSASVIKRVWRCDGDGDGDGTGDGDGQADDDAFCLEFAVYTLVPVFSSAMASAKSCLSDGKANDGNYCIYFLEENCYT